jgi:hypothetical protein
VEKIKAFIKHHLIKKTTIMILPHTSSKPLSISIKLYLLYLVSFFTFCVVLCSVYIVTKHINYMQTVTNNILLENKLKYFSKELVENRNYLMQIRETDKEMRILLGLKNKDAVIDAEGVGGPEPIDEQNIMNVLQGKYIFSIEEFNNSVKSFKQNLDVQIKSHKEILDYIHIERARRASMPQVWPAIGRITSTFGYRINPITGRMEFHKGIDISNVRKTPIIASARGKVFYTGWFGGYGKVVIIMHGFGFSTLYGHLSKIYVTPGQNVNKGDLIAGMGNTGLSTGNHVHFEVRCFNKPKNPFYFIGRKKKI